MTHPIDETVDQGVVACEDLETATTTETALEPNGRSTPPAPKADLEPAAKPEDGAPPLEISARLVAEWRAGRHAPVAAQAQALLVEYPRSSFLRNILGVVAGARGALDQAISFFATAADGAPRVAAPLENLARTYAAAGRFAEAAAAFERLREEFGLAEDAAGVGLRVVEAQARLSLGEAQRALEIYLEAFEIAPERDEPVLGAAEAMSVGVEARATPLFLKMLARCVAHPRVSQQQVHGAAIKLLIDAVEHARRAPDLGGEPVLDLEAMSPDYAALLAAFVGAQRVVNLRLERALTAKRRWVLNALAAAEEPVEALPLRLAALVEALARHSANIEYLWDEAADETPLVEALRARVEAALRDGAPVKAHELFLLGAYRPLHEIDAVRDWVAAMIAEPQRSGPLDPTLKELVADPLVERRLAASLPSLTPIEEGTSREVQAQYEANPYPRWKALRLQKPHPLRLYLEQALAPNTPDLSAIPAEPAVLVAGCGTGRHAITVAAGYEGARVIGLDLSRASLAYAARNAIELGVQNVTFVHGDILLIEDLAASFDVIESSGVIHHMAIPEQGLDSLVAALKPGGLMKLGLYSSRARALITRYREDVAERGFTPDLAGLRAFRAERLAEASGAPGVALGLEGLGDFYAASELRDLIFHVQETCYDLHEIAAMLAARELEFLGFTAVGAGLRSAYAEAEPQDATQTDLAGWARFEEKHPRTFLGMYQFWVRKPA